MKKCLILFVGSFALFTCKKNDIATIQPPPPPTYCYIVVDTSQFYGFGTVSPLSASVESGGTVTIVVTPKQGCRVAAASVNGIAVADTTVIVITNVETLVTTVKIRLTDSLSVSGKAAIAKLLIDSTWHDRVAYWRGWNPINPEPWQLDGYYSPCQQANYYNFFANGDYIEHDGVGACNTSPPTIYKATWQLGYNGKTLTLIDSTGTPTLTVIDTLTKDKFGYIYMDYQGQGKDYKVVATP